jgi:DNA-directed RNA polymerase specialized sigma24 family protein
MGVTIATDRRVPYDPGPPQGLVMSPECNDSVTHWIDALKTGDDEAARLLWQRYFSELVRLARAKLGAAPRGAADEEDVALSAFHSLCAGVGQHHFARLDGRDDLWRLLVTITTRKALDQIKHQRRHKRGGGRVLGEVELAGPGPDADAPGMDQFAGKCPTPEFAAIMDEECRRLLGALKDESTRQVALLRMEGYSGDEIAERLGCNRRTVTRKLDLIRRRWREEGESHERLRTDRL